MVEALIKSLGNVTRAAKTTGIHRDTHYEWLKHDPAYKHAYNMISEAAIDFAESKLFELINGVTMIMPGKDGQMQQVYTEKPNAAAIIFYLKTNFFCNT